MAAPVLCVHDLHQVRIYCNPCLRIVCLSLTLWPAPRACRLVSAHLPPPSAGTYNSATGESSSAACIDCGAGTLPRPPGADVHPQACLKKLGCLQPFTPCPSKVVALTIARPAPRAVPCHLVAAHSASPPQARMPQQLAPRCVSTAAQARFPILSALTGLTPALILASAPFVPLSIMAASSLRCVCTRWHLGSYLGP
jgi:hypothetical protein